LQLQQQASSLRPGFSPHHPSEGEKDDNSNFDNTDEFNPENKFQFGSKAQSFNQNAIQSQNYYPRQNDIVVRSKDSEESSDGNIPEELTDCVNQTDLNPSNSM
jgi:hypothetical protein